MKPKFRKVEPRANRSYTIALIVIAVLLSCVVGKSTWVHTDTHSGLASSALDGGEVESIETYNDSLSTMVSEIGEETRIVLIRQGIAQDRDLTIPSNISLSIEHGGGIKVCAGQILTLANPPSAGPYRIFDGPGKVTISQGTTMAEWWGVRADGNPDSNSSALQEAIDNTRGCLTINSDFACRPSTAGPGSMHGNSRRRSKTCSIMKSGLCVDGRDHVVTLVPPNSEAYLNYVFTGSTKDKCDNVVFRNLKFDATGSWIKARCAFGFYGQSGITIENIEKTSRVSQVFIAQNADYGTVNNVSLGTERAKLGWMVFCDQWRINKIKGGAISSEMLDLDGMNSYITIDNVIQEGYRGKPEVFDINCSRHIVIRNVTLRNVYKGILANTREFYDNWTDYEAALGGGRKKTSHQPGGHLTIEDISIDKAKSYGIKLGASKGHAGVSCLGDVKLKNVKIHAPLNGVHVEEVTNLAMNNILIERASGRGIFMRYQSAEAREDSDLTVRMNSVKVIDAKQEGIRIDYISELEANDILIDSANSGDARKEHFIIKNIGHNDAKIEIDGLHCIAGRYGYVGFTLKGSNSGCEVRIGTLTLEGRYERADIDTDNQEGIHFDGTISRVSEQGGLR